MRYFETRQARIEIIPMIDIMLFLLVFFAMMTLRMIPTSGHISKLPQSTTATAIPSPKLLVQIQSAGHLMVEGKILTPTDLTALVRAKDPAHLAVTIAGSEDATLEHLMRAIDAVRHGGATQIGLAARQAAL
jgi:biopolymer transport protein ExbD